MSTHPDRYGVEVIAGSSAAVAHLDAAVDSFLRFANDGGDHLGAALEADPAKPLLNRPIVSLNPLGMDSARPSISATPANMEIPEIMARLRRDGDVRANSAGTLLPASGLT